MEAVLKEVFGIWYLIGAALVFFMQAGFAMVETGFTRAKNAGNILMKNLMDFCLGTVAFLLVGYSLLCGQDMFGVIGWHENPLFNFSQTNWSTFTFNLVFCATAATIVSGAMAERTKFISYCVYSFVISLVVYPIEAHWVWGSGWLANLGFHDFAGSAVIHYVGGLTALIGAKMVGARIGKFDAEGRPKVLAGHNLTIGALGVFILWFGWYGFNGAAAQNGLQLATIFATTTVAPALATCTVMLVSWLKQGKPDVAMSLNGSLAGLVAITAGCDAVDVFGASIIGILSGLCVIFFVWLLDYRLKIDDPVGAVAVHFGNGLLGTLCVGLFATQTDTMGSAQGLFYGGGFHLLFVQVVGLLAIGLWTAVTMGIVFWLIKATLGLRVSQEEELAGLDYHEHGLESAYAGFVFEQSGLLDSVESPSETPKLSIETSHFTDLASTSIYTVVIFARPEKLDSLRQALDQVGITGMNVSTVRGCGIQKGQLSQYRGVVSESKFLPKVRVEVTVCSVPVDKVVEAAQKVLYTGQAGDGKIFVYPCLDVVRISQGLHGPEALQY